MPDQEDSYDELDENVFHAMQTRHWIGIAAILVMVVLLYLG